MTYKNSNMLLLEAKIVLPRFLEEIWEDIDKADAMGENNISFTLPSNVFLVEGLEKELTKSNSLKQINIQEVNGAYVLNIKWRRASRVAQNS